MTDDRQIRVVTLGDHGVGVVSRGERAHRVAAFVLGSEPTDEAYARTIEVESDDDTLRIVCGDQRMRAAEPGHAATLLADLVVHELIDPLEGCLAIHSAALADDEGNAILLPAPSGSGKSTLALLLPRHGLHLLGDEITGIWPEPKTLRAWRRPVCLKIGSRAQLDAVLSVDGRDDVLRWSGGDLVQPAAINPRPPPQDTRLKMLLFPTFDRGSELELEPLTRARGAKLLLEQLVNARNLPGNGFPAALGLVRGLDCWTLRYGSSEQLTEVAARLIDILRAD